MQHKVEICGVNTSKLKVLKSDETQQLLLKAKAGRQPTGRAGPPVMPGAPLCLRAAPPDPGAAATCLEIERKGVERR